MSQELIALSTEKRSYLTGFIHTSKDEKSNSVPVYVVIVDDNSGSMSGLRANYCVEKTKVIIRECIAKGVEYQYATFGSRNTQRGKILENDVWLDASEGTLLSLLAQAALEATSILTKSLTPNHIFRMLYVLNTDGEAHDGQAAAQSFLQGYNDLKARFPNMIEARTFVLGIGANHDQKVLGAMSVGEASYFNYPDHNLDAMSTDSVSRIYPELTGSKKPINLTLDHSGVIVAFEENGEIDLSNIRVSRDDTLLTLPDGTSYQLRHKLISPSDSSYFDICLKGIQEDSLSLARSIKLLFEMKQKNQISPEKLNEEMQAITSRCELLTQELNSIEDPTNEETLISAALGNLLPNVSDDFKAMRRARQQIYNTVRKQIKAIRSNVTDKKSATRSVLTLCETGIQSLRLGTLSVDIERDYMEVLGSGGFKHWTNKKKSRVTNRALEQADPDAVANADEKAAAILSKYSASLHELARSEDLDESEEEFLESTSRSCWLTLMKDADLTAEGDVLCLVGYVPPSSRNLGLCSVSSSKVLHSAILNGKVEICPHPMSFLTFRQLALEGKSISRGPNGHPINVCVSFLPIATSPLSCELAFCYTPLCASQLLTSRWIYTVGTGEYRNGVLSAIMSLVSSGVGEVQLKTLMTAIDGFCTSLKGSTFLNDLFNRAQNFSRGYATSGEVPTFIVALGDQLALLWGYKHGCQLQGNILDISSFSTTQYWRTLFFRILRDKFDGMFTAYCTPNDPDGDSKRRQKEIDAEDTIEFLVQGFNTTTDPYGLLNQSMVSPDWKSYFQKVGAYSIDPKHRTELNLDSIKLSVTTLDEGIDLCTFFEEETLDNLTTFHEPSPSLTVIDEKEQSISNSIETISLPSNIEDLISSLLDFKRKLPERGHPSSLLTDEQVVDGDGSNGGKSHITPYRKYFILQIIKSLSRELQYLVKSSIHMVYQLSEGQCSIDEPNPTTIFDLLGIEPNQEGFLWLLSQIILAIKLRTNSRYRADLEKYHASTTTAATTSTSMIPPSETELLEGGESTSSFLSFNPLQLLNKLNIQYTNKQIQHYEELQKIRIRNLQQKYRRIYLSAPGNTSYSPLRIYSEKHLLKINNWILKYRNYQIRRTMSPITNSYTSMAKNTYLTPLNRYFMTECNPYHICSIIYGNSSERSFLLYYEHLHTFSSRIINNLYNPTDDESTSTSSGKNVLEDIQKFQKYRQLFYEHYGPTHPFDDKNEIVLLDVWISFSFDYLLNQLSSSRYDNDVTSTSNSMRIQEYSDKLYQYLYEFYTGTSSSSGSGTTTSTTSIPPIPPGASGVITSRLSSQIKLELLWHTNPEEYLNDYFTSQRFEERISMKPSLEEYLHLIATSGSRIRGNEMEEVIEDDLELAKKVYFEEYAIDMEINRNALIG